MASLELVADTPMRQLTLIPTLTLSLILSQSLKNVPGGTDVLGKWKSVPGKIRIRASIFTSIFMLFYINIPFKLIVSDALRIAIKHECIF